MRHTRRKLCVCESRAYVQARLVKLSSHPGHHSHTRLYACICCQATVSQQLLANINIAARVGRIEEFGDLPKLTKIDWQFIPSVAVKNHPLSIALFFERHFT